MRITRNLLRWERGLAYATPQPRGRSPPVRPSPSPEKGPPASAPLLHHDKAAIRDVCPLPSIAKYQLPENARRYALLPLSASNNPIGRLAHNTSTWACPRTILKIPHSCTVTGVFPLPDTPFEAPRLPGRLPYDSDSEKQVRPANGIADETSSTRRVPTHKQHSTGSKEQSACSMWY